MNDYADRDEFAIWPNKRKELDTHPDFTGSARINGVEYWVNAWKRREGASPNAPSLKGSLKRKDAPPMPDSVDKVADEVDDDIPF